MAFYEDSKSPNILKSCILKLLSRLIIKLRFVCTKIDQPSSLSHFDKTFVTKDFVQSLLTEMMIQMESSNNLHGAFV